MDRRSRQNHRRRQARAPSVRFYPLAQMLECYLRNSHSDAAVVEELIPKPHAGDDDGHVEQRIHAGHYSRDVKMSG